MRIALIDLNHMTMGVHTNTIPLGIGVIGFYIKKNFKQRCSIRMFKDASKCLEALKDWKPDILGITQYSWNSELNLYVARLVKQNYPDCFIVAGGPNLYLTKEEKTEYLKKNYFVDLCVSYDGEIPLAEVAQRLKRKEKNEDIQSSPPAGTYSLSKQGELIDMGAPPRLTSLDDFGALYASGWFDDLMDQGFHPFLQTQRGCPFQCAYCHTGNKYCSKVIFQSEEHFSRDMEYLGKRFSGQHSVILYMANTNFGLFEGDLNIARIIRNIQDKYDWPKNININTGSDPNKVIEVLSVLKYKYSPAIALQSLTPKVLANIKRKNLEFSRFVSFQKKVTQLIGENTATELILNLPEETKESFLKGVSKVLDSGVQNIVIYTLMSLRGTPISSQKTIKRYGHVIRHRIVPRCFSEINGSKIFEIEDVVVGTDAMPFEDYLSLRGVSLLISVFAGSIEMYPIRKFMLEYKLPISDWIFGIHRAVSSFAGIYSGYMSFLDETKDELFSSPQELIEFFTKNGHYEQLRNGRFGDNLLRKYKAIILSEHYKECLGLAFFQLRAQAKQRINLELLDSMLFDLEVYLNSRDVGYIFKEGYGPSIIRNETLNYNIPGWLKRGRDNSLENYRERSCYSIVVTEYMHKRLDDFRQMNRNPKLSAQILYRDGYINDFWPLWVSARP